MVFRIQIKDLANHNSYSNSKIKQWLPFTWNEDLKMFMYFISKSILSMPLYKYVYTNIYIFNYIDII